MRNSVGLLILGLIIGLAPEWALAKDVPPKVKLTSPANHAVFAAPATITLEASASDKDGTIKRVQFFNGNKKLATITSTPYAFTWTNVKAGKYTLTAVATDNKGVKTTSHEVHIIVDITPAVSLTSPANGATFKAPAMIPLVATAKDTDGKIAKVEFFAGANLLATLTAKPYTFTLNNVAPGNYSLTARATDNRGLITTSSAVTITVTSGAAQLFFIYTDQLNTPRVITDQTNKVVWRWDSQDPFGANVPDEDPDGDGIKFTCNLRFPGQHFDKETNTHYNYYRDYDPTIGRYLRSDPTGLLGGLNLYVYVGNRPTTLTDPRGLLAPGYHSRLSYDALADCPKQRFAASYAAWRVDFISGSQDPLQANWHGMCRPNQPTAQGTAWIYSMIDYQLKTCTPDGLGRALHAAEDLAARGHKGCEEWNGELTWDHIMGDLFPTPEELADASSNARDVVRRFKQNCPCACGN